jgi:hypothetical protein
MPTLNPHSRSTAIVSTALFVEKLKLLCSHRFYQCVGYAMRKGDTHRPRPVVQRRIHAVQGLGLFPVTSLGRRLR